VCQWSPRARGSSIWVVLDQELWVLVLVTWVLDISLVQKQYRLSYSTVTISELAAFDLLNMLFKKHDETSFYMIN